MYSFFTIQKEQMLIYISYINLTPNLIFHVPEEITAVKTTLLDCIDKLKTTGAVEPAKSGVDVSVYSTVFAVEFQTAIIVPAL